MTVIRSAALPQALSAYQAALKRSQAAPAAGTGATPAFESFLKNEVETAAKDLRASETQSVQALAG